MDVAVVRREEAPEMIYRSHPELKRGAPWVLVFLVLSVLAPQLALACSCGTTTLAAQFARSDHVFTAIVIDEYIEASDDRYPVRSLYSITESFKGAPSFGALISQPDGNSCGIDIDAGVEYLFFVPNSGQIGLCDGIRATDRAGPQLSALRAFTYGRNPDLSEPWRFSASDDGCWLGTIFQSGEETFSPGNLHFLHRSSVADGQEPTELRIRVGVYDLKRDGEHNALEILFAEKTWLAPWRTRESREQVLGDGSKRILNMPDDFVIGGQPAIGILRSIAAADTFRIRFDADGFGPEVDTEIGTYNMGSGAADFLRCVQSR